MFETEEIERVANDLAGMSGVDLAAAGQRQRRVWLARGLALMHLAAGDMPEAQKVMAGVAA